MSRNIFYTVLFILLPVIYFLSRPIVLGDLAIWIAQGKAILAQGEVIKTDQFSVLKTYPLVYSALSCLLYALIDLVGGLQLVTLFHKLLLALSLGQILLYWRNKNQLAWTYQQILISIFCLAGSSLMHIDRQIMVVLPLFIAAYILIEEHALDDIKNFFVLFILMVIWTNSHGSWVILPAMHGWKLLVTCIQDKWNFKKHYKAMVFGASLLLASLLNPFGINIWFYVLETAKVSRYRAIEEWDITAPWVLLPFGALYYVFAVGGCYLIYRQRQKLNAFILQSPFVFLFIFGFTGIRHIGLVFLAFLIFYAKYFGFGQAVTEAHAGKKWINALIIGVLSLFLISLTPYFKKNLAPFLPPDKKLVYNSSEPILAAEAIKQSGHSGPIFAEWGYGSYLAYAVTNKITLDARNIIFSNEDIELATQTINGEGDWRSYIQKYNFEFILVNKNYRQHFISQLKADADWQLIFDEGEFSLFQKK